jgi:hypothetical protein
MEIPVGLASIARASAGPIKAWQTLVFDVPGFIALHHLQHYNAQHYNARAKNRPAWKYRFMTPPTAG